MRGRNSLSPVPLLLFSIIGMLFFTAVIYFLSAPYQTVYIHPVTAKQKTIETPVRLKIPSINVDALIEETGLTQSGAMDAPKDPANAAWFHLGPRPGEEGSSVIDGHSGRKNGAPAVFDDLYKLKKGDKIFVEDANDTMIVFTVRELRTYDPSKYAPEVFDSSDKKAHLNLITCAGAWDKEKKTHSERIIVFSDKE